jgi:hypothetical protein
MEYKYSINEKYNTVFVKLEGQTRIKDFFSGIVAITDNPSYKPGVNFLLDFTSLENYYTDYCTFQKFTENLKKFNTLFSSKISCIVKAGVIMGYIDMIAVELEGDGLDLAVFQLTCKAAEFLGFDCSRDDFCLEIKKLCFTCEDGFCSNRCRKRKKDSAAIVQY